MSEFLNGPKVNCFGIPDTYRSWRIKQGADNRFYVDAPADAATWDELREEIDAWTDNQPTSAAPIEHEIILSALAQYRDDLIYTPDPDSRDRRLSHVKTLIAALSASNAA